MIYCRLVYLFLSILQWRPLYFSGELFLVMHDFSINYKKKRVLLAYSDKAIYLRIKNVIFSTLLFLINLNFNVGTQKSARVDATGGKCTFRWARDVTKSRDVKEIITRVRCNEFFANKHNVAQIARLSYNNYARSLSDRAGDFSLLFTNQYPYC